MHLGEILSGTTGSVGMRSPKIYEKRRKFERLLKIQVETNSEKNLLPTLQKSGAIDDLFRAQNMLSSPNEPQNGMRGIVARI